MRLHLTPLESRLTPATFSYNSVSSTLTIKAAEGDHITVQPTANEPLGYVTASDGTNTFSSSTKVQPVRSLVVKFDQVDQGNLELFTGLNLGGNLTVTGAKVATQFTSRAQVAGSFSFKYAFGGKDDTVLLDGMNVGRDATIEMGAGKNFLLMNGGTVGRNLTVAGGYYSTGTTVKLLGNADLTVGGNATFTLGSKDVADTFELIGPQALRVGRNLKITSDILDADLTAGTVAVRGNFKTWFDGTLDVGELAVHGSAEVKSGSDGLSAIFHSPIDVYSWFTTTFVAGSSNFLRLAGGFIGSDLTVTGGTGNDTVHLAEVADLHVGRNAAFNLGAGGNSIQGQSARRLHVGLDMTVTGGNGNDLFDFAAFNTPLFVGSVLKFEQGDGNNNILADRVDVGVREIINGGYKADTVVQGKTTIGGRLDVSLSGGTNNFFMAPDITVGSSLIYRGFSGVDVVRIPSGTVGRSLELYVEKSTAAGQSVELGKAGDLFVGDRLNVIGDDGVDTFHLNRLHVGGEMLVKTGGESDIVAINDVAVTGATTIDLGAGNDILKIEADLAFGATPLDQKSSFGSKVTVRGQDGDDTVTLRDANGQGITFLKGVSLIGGAGANDKLNVGANVVVLTLDKTETFELGDSLP